MKNLKKVLALVMAFAIAFTVMASAAYTDQADIEASAAVDMLTALGVINGNPDGSFKPNGTVTRAEMAKMIYTVRNGGNSDASSYASMTSTFTDINGHWAAGYIKYCQSIGIIAGKSATSFAPDDLVTGLEAAKMLLVCAGYTADKAGLIGTNWANRTLALASENELLTDVDSPIASGLPRQYAAQIIYNALDMRTYVYSKDIEDFKYASDVATENTIGAKYMGLVKSEAGVLRAVSKVDGKDYYTITTTGGDHTYNKVPTDVSSLIGQEVKVLKKDKSNSTDVYGVYADEDSKVTATGYVGTLKFDSAATDEKIKLNGTSYKLAEAAEDMDVFAVNTTSTSVKLDDITEQTAANTVAATVKLIDNDSNGKVDSVVYTPVTFGKVNSVSKSAITVSGVGTIKFEDASIYDGVAKDDYVLVTDDSYVASGDDVVTKLDVTSGKVSGTRGSAGSYEVKVDTTWYKLASSFTSNLTTGTTYDLVLVGGFVLAADETASASSKNIAYVSAFKATANDALGTANVTQDALLYFADGTKKTVEVSKNNGTKLTSGTLFASGNAQKLYNYSVLSDGTYDIKVIATKPAGYDSFVATGTLPGNSGASAYNKQKISGVALNDDAVVYVETGNETKVLTGKQIKNWADSISAIDFASSYLTKESNGIQYVQIATLVSSDTEDVPGATKDTLYGYLTADAYLSDVDGDDKATYEVWTSEGAKTLYADTSSEPAQTAGQVIKYNINGSYIENISVVGTDAAITGFDYKSEGTLAYTVATVDASPASNITQKSLDEDCVFAAIDDENTAGVEDLGMDDIIFANPATDSAKVLANAIVVVSSEDKVVAIFFDSANNELDSATAFYK